MTAPAGARWQDVREKGSALGIRLLFQLGTMFGRRIPGLILPLVAAWYVVLHPSVRRASQAYLRRIQGRVRLRDVYRHVHCFARVVLDRFFMVRGDLRPFQITFEGQAHLESLRETGRGAVLIVSHLGSFEVLRALSVERAFPVSILGYFKNANLINTALRRVNPAIDTHVIEIRPGDASFVFEAERCVSEGRLVGTMGDRVGFDGKHARVTFLGSDASFPTGPYLLAAALRCPVYLAFGLYREPNRYELHCEPFEDLIDLPRGAREDALHACVARYAARLEHHCRLAPYNWFNFYDFWSSP
jgi:predicted LPLAT superfamily acyltransferase